MQRIASGTQKNAAGFDPNRVHVAPFADDLTYVKLQKPVVDARNRKHTTYTSFEQRLSAHPRRQRCRHRYYFNSIPDLHVTTFGRISWRIFFHQSEQAM
jgi:hypothetical protein